MFLTLLKKKFGEHKPSRLVGIFKCEELSNVKGEITEFMVIASRAPISLEKDSYIMCFSFGSYWKAPQRCLHPLHESTKKVSLRQSTLEQYIKLNEIYPSKFPYAANICAKHRQTEYLSVVEEKYDSFQPGIISPDSSFNIDDAKTFLETSVPDISPVKYQINKTPIQDTSRAVKSYHIKKFHQAVEEYKKSYSQLVAPGQEQEFLDMVEGQSESPATSATEIPTDLVHLHDAFNTASTQNQMMILHHLSSFWSNPSLNPITRKHDYVTKYNHTTILNAATNRKRIECGTTRGVAGS